MREHASFSTQVPAENLDVRRRVSRGENERTWKRLASTQQLGWMAYQLQCQQALGKKTKEQLEKSFTGIIEGAPILTEWCRGA
ncbi:hypothetical protein MRX96_028426 [Rhipicephalus microplus]